MTFPRDVALSEGPDGKALAHRADCPDVRLMAEMGYPVMTMFDCQAPLPDDVARHSCLEAPA